MSRLFPSFKEEREYIIELWGEDVDYEESLRRKEFTRKQLYEAIEAALSAPDPFEEP